MPKVVVVVVIAVVVVVIVAVIVVPFFRLVTVFRLGFSVISICLLLVPVLHHLVVAIRCTHSSYHPVVCPGRGGGGGGSGGGREVDRLLEAPDSHFNSASGEPSLRYQGFPFNIIFILC